MTHHVVESISELSAMMKVGAMAGSEKDAGFCSGCDEDDMSDLHSPSASEDSLEVQVMPISLKNKRKLAEPRKIQEGNPAPLKKRKYEQVEEQRVPDEESSRTLRSPSPFRPWSCTSKNVADSKLIAEKNTDKLCGFSSISDESAATSVTSSRANHRHHYCHHRHHNYHHHHYPTSGGDNREDDRNNERDQDRVLNLNSKNAERDTSEKQCEGDETLAGRQRQDKTRAARTETDFAAASAKITTPETTLSSSAAASPLPRLQEEPLSLVLRGDVAARVPSHPAVNGSYEKNYSVGTANVSSASSSISSSSSSSCSSSSSGSSSSSSPSFSSLTSQQNHRTRSNGENSCSTTRTTTVSITSTITTPTTTVTGIQSGQPTRQYSAAGQQRNYKNMTRERRIEANARERTRVHTISAAFDTLRRAIPAYSHNQKLSKLSVLRIACSYIMTLGKIVNTPEGEPANGASLGACVDLVSRTIQTEGKLRKRKED